MAIVYRFTEEGGFVAGDTETGATSYAYWSSEHATKAKRNPEAIAREMAAKASEIQPLLPAQIVADYNARNWARLPK